MTWTYPSKLKKRLTDAPLIGLSLISCRSLLDLRLSMSDLLELRPKPARKPKPQRIEQRPESLAAPAPRSTPTRKRWPSVKLLPQQQRNRRPPHRASSRRSDKLQKYRRTSNLELLLRSAPAVLPGRKLSNRLYVDGVALPAQRVGSLAVVWREECQGFQLYSWELRSPLSSLLFETMEYCCEAAVELGQRFDVDGLFVEQAFGVLEKIEELLETHLQREQIALSLRAG